LDVPLSGPTATDEPATASIIQIMKEELLKFSLVKQTCDTFQHGCGMFLESQSIHLFRFFGKRTLRLLFARICSPRVELLVPAAIVEGVESRRGALQLRHSLLLPLLLILSGLLEIVVRPDCHMVLLLRSPSLPRL
jgi:hypothetical protein